MIAVVGVELGMLLVALPHTDPLLLRAAVAGMTEALAAEMAVVVERAVIVFVETAVAVAVVMVAVGVGVVVVFHGEIGVVDEVAMVDGVGEGGVVVWALLR